jgi:hypothetical protein
VGRNLRRCIEERVYESETPVGVPSTGVWDFKEVYEGMQVEWTTWMSDGRGRCEVLVGLDDGAQARFRIVILALDFIGNKSSQSLSMTRCWSEWPRDVEAHICSSWKGVQSETNSSANPE